MKKTWLVSALGTLVGTTVHTLKPKCPHFVPQVPTLCNLSAYTSRPKCLHFATRVFVFCRSVVNEGEVGGRSSAGNSLNRRWKGSRFPMATILGKLVHELLGGPSQYGGIIYPSQYGDDVGKHIDRAENVDQCRNGQKEFAGRIVFVASAKDVAHVAQEGFEVGNGFFPSSEGHRHGH